TAPPEGFAELQQQLKSIAADLAAVRHTLEQQSAANHDQLTHIQEQISQQSIPLLSSSPLSSPAPTDKPVHTPLPKPAQHPAHVPSKGLAKVVPPATATISVTTKAVICCESPPVSPARRPSSRIGKQKQRTATVLTWLVLHSAGRFGRIGGWFESE